MQALSIRSSSFADATVRADADAARYAVRARAEWRRLRWPIYTRAIGFTDHVNFDFRLQRKFAERVRAAGHEVVLVEAQDTESQRHNLTSAAFKSGALCAKDVAADQLVGQVRAGSGL